MAIERFVVGLSQYHHRMPVDHTLAGLVAELGPVCPMSTDLADRIKGIEIIDDMCSLSPAIRIPPGKTAVREILAVCHEVQEFVDAHIGSMHTTQTQRKTIITRKNNMKATWEKIFEYASMPLHGTMSRKLRKGRRLQINEGEVYEDDGRFNTVCLPGRHGSDGLSAAVAFCVSGRCAPICGAYPQSAKKAALSPGALVRLYQHTAC